MVHLSKPSLPPSKPYYRPLKNPEYLKDSNLDAHLKVVEVAIRANSEIDDVEIVNMFNFTLGDSVSNWCNNCLGDYPYCTFVEF
jgi:hypothetical protein